MPPRLVVAAVVLGWLATMAWLASEKWLPWWQPSEPPPFAVELADEVAPEHASWHLYRQGTRAGSAETRMAPRKDGTFELTSRLRDVDLSRGQIEVKMPVFASTRIVSRTGDLISLEAKAVMEVSGFGSDFRLEATIHGDVVGDEFRGQCEFDVGDGKTIELLEPVKLSSKNAFSPLQPVHKFPPLRAGQTWRVTNVDPVSDALAAALKQVFGKKLPLPIFNVGQPRQLLARVQSETEEVSHRAKSYTCWVIVYEGDRTAAKTWVDVTDGRVVRQEASGTGETLVLQRD